MGGGLHLEGAHHFGKEDIHLVQLAVQIEVQHQLCHIPGPAHVGVLGRVEKLHVDGDAVLQEVGAAHLPHHKEALDIFSSASLRMLWL